MVPALLICLSRGQAGFDAVNAWNTVSQSIRGRYYARQTQKDKLDRLLAKYQPIASRTGNPGDFANAVNRMIEEFGDSHFGLFTKRDQGFYTMDALLKGQQGREAAPMPNFGAWIRPGKDGFEVQMVINGTSAEKAGLRVGDVLVRIAGKPFSPIDSLAGLVGTEAKLEWRRGGQSMQGMVGVKSESVLDMFLQGSRDSTRVIPSGAKKFGYFHLWTQASSKFSDAVEAAMAGPLRQTDAMILDLRDGFGGRPEKVADPFFRPEVQLEWDMGTGTAMRQQFGYQRPLVVLINHGSRSAKEVLAFILQKCKRATLIGTRTAGHVLGTFPQAIGDWAYLEIPMVDLKTDGQRLEGLGVKPDIELPAEYDADGKDLVIERAIQFLSQQRGGSK